MRDKFTFCLKSYIKTRIWFPGPFWLCGRIIKNRQWRLYKKRDTGHNETLEVHYDQVCSRFLLKLRLRLRLRLRLQLRVRRPASFLYRGGA